MSSVIAERQGAVGVATLARPEKLNALTAEMVEDLHRALDRFEADARIRSVVFRSQGEKAFCAGGDIRAVRALVLEGELEKAVAFFAREFALNLRIARYSKPIVSLIHGLCLGGGCGLSMHGAYRVAAPSSRIAMPETAIGYFPDVGASHFLSRLPGGIGLYLGMTGAEIGADAARVCGLATHLAPRDDFDGIVETLARGTSADEALAAYAAAPGSWPAGRLTGIGRFFQGASSTAEIRDRLRAAGDDAVAGEIGERLRAASPGSIEIAFALQCKATVLTLEETLEMELSAARKRIQEPDFIEGVRARLVDRDAPRWERSGE